MTGQDLSATIAVVNSYKRGSGSAQERLRQRVRAALDVRGRWRDLKAGGHQADMARRIGKTASWLRKYQDGTQSASFDQAITLMREFAISFEEIAGAASGLSSTERRFLIAVRGLPPRLQEGVFELVMQRVRLLRAQDVPPSGEQTGFEPPAIRRRSRGTPRNG